MKIQISIVLACLLLKLEAAVIYTALPNIPVQSFEQEVFYYLDLNKDGISELAILSSAQSDRGAQVLPSATNRVFSTVETPPDIGSDALNLAPGTLIGSSLLNQPNTSLTGTKIFTAGLLTQTYGPTLSMCVSVDSDTVCLGQFGLFQPGYLGVEFDILGEIHFGYVHISGTGYNGAILKGFAYETLPGVPIMAGAVPEPSIGFLLLLGSTWFVWRRGPREIQ